MGSLGLPELVIILIIIILIFGANRLPEIGRGIGKGIRNFKDATRDGQNESKRSEALRESDGATRRMPTGAS